MIVSQKPLYSLNDRDPKLLIISIPTVYDLKPLQIAGVKANVIAGVTTNAIAIHL